MKNKIAVHNDITFYFLTYLFIYLFITYVSYLNVFEIVAFVINLPS